MTQTLSKDAVKEYYGTILQGTADLKTSACCCGDDILTPSVKAALGEINDEVMTRFYGCGSPLPPLLDGCTVLDLGCGTGRDVFVAARLTGPTGRVIGIDMTDEQLAVARRHADAQMARFGYDQPNVDFRQGYMEDLKSVGIEDHSIDVVMSNCVLNLSPDKRAVFAEIFRVLKPGGELIFSDVFSDRRVPVELHADPVLHGECLAGALYLEDFRRMLTSLGYPDYRVTARRRFDLNNPDVERKIGMIQFDSITVRAFALRDLEDRDEDYGHVATYRGTIPDAPHAFDLDLTHRLVRGKPMRVSGNTAAILQSTRYHPHFTVTGDRSIHFGLLEGGSTSFLPMC